MQQTQPPQLTPLFDLKAMYQGQLDAATEEKRKEIEQEIAYCDLLILQHDAHDRDWIHEMWQEVIEVLEPILKQKGYVYDKARI